MLKITGMRVRERKTMHNFSREFVQMADRRWFRRDKKKDSIYYKIQNRNYGEILSPTAHRLKIKRI